MPIETSMTRPTKAAQFRRNAYYCQILATDAASAADRACLMIMRRAWLALADNEDWLDGAHTMDIKGA
jgi:hypothetical protein